MRLQPSALAGTILAAAVCFSAPAGAQREPFAHDLFRLVPDVASAAERGRAAATAADDAAAEARETAEQAAWAAERARADAAGTIAGRYDDGNSYEGETDGNGRNGYGVFTFGAASSTAGDSHAGYYVNGAVQGPAVYSFAANAANASGAVSYEGDYVDDVRNGQGVFSWRTGELYAGDYRNDRANGYGIYFYSDGRRYEGEFADDQINGYGVLWTPEGGVSQAGVWTNGRLTTSLSR